MLRVFYDISRLSVQGNSNSALVGFLDSKGFQIVEKTDKAVVVEVSEEQISAVEKLNSYGFSCQQSCVMEI